MMRQNNPHRDNNNNNDDYDENGHYPIVDDHEEEQVEWMDNENNNNNQDDEDDGNNNNDNNDNNNNNGEQGNNNPNNLIPRRIEDLDAWIERYGLHGPQRCGQESVRNVQEARARIQQEESYQRALYERWFAQDERKARKDITTGSCNDKNADSTVSSKPKTREERLQEWQNESIGIYIRCSCQNENGNVNDTITTTPQGHFQNETKTNDVDDDDDGDDDKIRDSNRERNPLVRLVSLATLARHSDTIYVLASSREQFQQIETDTTTTATTRAQTLDSFPQQVNTDNTTLTISLEEYAPCAVETFLKVVDFCQSHFTKVKTNSTKNIDSGTVKNPLGLSIAKEIQTYHLIPSEDMIDCCRIAHYLQCPVILTGIVEILCESVDTANCMSLCQLADQLHLPTLLEASLSHMMRTLTDIEEHDIWNDLTNELKTRIGLIKQLLAQPSTHIHTTSKKLYFSSFHEYLAIFAEQVEYYRERLTEAKHQQAQHAYSGINNSISTKTSRAWQYTQSKIEQHEQRVKTLEMIMAEQKLLFASTGDFGFREWRD